MNPSAQQTDAATALIAARMAAPYIHSHECLRGTAAKLQASAWAIAWGREMSVEQQELQANLFEAALTEAGCHAIRWYDGLVCWRTPGGDAGHLQLTRVATHGRHEAEA